MKDKIKLWLTPLYHSAKKEFSERPIATTGVLATLLAVTIPLVLSRVLRGFVFYQVSKIMMPQTELSLFPLCTSIFVLVLVACLLRSKKKEKKGKDFYFIPYDKFTWKVKMLGNRQFSVDLLPYCKKHQIKLIQTGDEKDILLCPVCGTVDAINLPYRRRKNLHDAVSNLAEAQLEDHIARDEG